MKYARLIATFLVLFLLTSTGDAAEWGFRTNSGDYISLDRNADGSLSGSLLELKGADTPNTHAITGYNIEKGKMTLKIPDLYGDKEITLIRGVENGNVTWSPDPKSSGDIALELRGITNRSDTLADQILLNWKGDTSRLISASTFSALTAYVEQKYGKALSTGKPVGIVTPHNYAAFWDAYSGKANTDASIRTYFDGSNFGTALVATNTDVLMQAYAYTRVGDTSTQALLGDINTKAYVISGTHSRMSILRVPTRSFFDDYYENTESFEKIKAVVAKMFDAISNRKHCDIVKQNNKLGEIQCLYHSSEYNFSGNSWMRTIVAFFIEDAALDGKRTLAWEPISYFAKGLDVDEAPYEDQFLRIEDKKPYSEIENAMLTRFFDALSQTYKGSEVIGWR